MSMATSRVTRGASLTVGRDGCCRVIEAGEGAAALVRSKMYRGLVDFDDHLSDVSLDWTNAGLASH